MERLLQGRIQAGGVYRPDANGPVKPFGMNLGFLSLLFAVLASGCQLSDLAIKERELTSWVFGKWDGSIAFEAHTFSLLFLSMPADGELCVAADGGGNTGPVDYQQCPLV